MNATVVLLFFGGILCMYAAVVNQDPRNILLDAIGQEGKYPALDPEVAEQGYIRSLPPNGGGGGGGKIAFTSNGVRAIPGV